MNERGPEERDRRDGSARERSCDERVRMALDSNSRFGALSANPEKSALSKTTPAGQLTKSHRALPEFCLTLTQLVQSRPGCLRSSSFTGWTRTAACCGANGAESFRTVKDSLRASVGLSWRAGSGDGESDVKLRKEHGRVSIWSSLRTGGLNWTHAVVATADAPTASMSESLPSRTTMAARASEEAAAASNAADASQRAILERCEAESRVRSGRSTLRSDEQDDTSRR